MVLVDSIPSHSKESGRYTASTISEGFNCCENDYENVVFPEHIFSRCIYVRSATGHNEGSGLSAAAPDQRECESEFQRKSRTFLCGGGVVQFGAVGDVDGIEDQ